MACRSPRCRCHMAAPRELLIDRFVIASAPSLALALRPATKRPAMQTRVAVVSDPVYTPDDRRLTIVAGDTANYRGAEAQAGRLARLPYSAIEARAVVRAFAGADVIELAGFNATARRVTELPSPISGYCTSPPTPSPAATRRNCRRCFSGSSPPMVRRCWPIA